MVLVHARALLADNQDTTVVEGDLEHPHQLLASPGLRGHIDFDQPVGLLLTAVLYYVLVNDRRAAVVATLRDGLCSGSYLALSHIASDSGRADTLARAQEIYRMFVRYSQDVLPDREQVRALFAGWDLVEPGLVTLPEWRPDQPRAGRPDQPTSAAAPTWFVGGVARKP
jgi:hypothetical protein